MPDLLRAKRDRRKRLAEFGYHLFDLASYENVYLLSPSRKDLFFNGGYLPLDVDFLHSEEYRDEAHCAMMYHFVGKSNVADLLNAPSRILDVGCGQGGGVLYLSKLYPTAQVKGTDRSFSAALRARRNVSKIENAKIVRTGTNEAGLEGDRINLIVSVGTPTYIGLARFIEEAREVAAPGAVVSFTGGYRQSSHDAVRSEIEAAATAAGMELVRYTDITPNTFAALQADIPRRERMLERVPWPFRKFGRRWADLPGSPEYEEYENGLRVDFAAVLKMPSTS